MAVSYSDKGDCGKNVVVKDAMSGIAGTAMPKSV